jgi:hypothetical protein
LSTKRNPKKKIIFSREVPPKPKNNLDSYQILLIKEALQGQKSNVKSPTKNAQIIHAAKAKENPQHLNLNLLPNLLKDKNPL